jgi:hypothetical protein
MHRALWVTQHEIETILYVVASPKDAKVSITAVAIASSFMGLFAENFINVKTISAPCFRKIN